MKYKKLFRSGVVHFLRKWCFSPSPLDPRDLAEPCYCVSLFSWERVRYKIWVRKRPNLEIRTRAFGRDPFQFTGRAGAINPMRKGNQEMKTGSMQIVPHAASTRGGLVRGPQWRRGLLVVGIVLALTAVAAPAFSGQSAGPQNPGDNTIPDVKCVIGLEDIKPGAKGTLASSPKGLEFTSGKKRAEIATPSIQDVFTGRESRQDVSGMGGTLVEAAIPYGGGRFVSLFSHKVDVLAVEYLDSNGGFHGAIFVLSAGKATAFKNLLIARGAKVSMHVGAPEPTEQKR